MSQNRVAVVTGANKGIGFAIVKALCKKFNGDVILTARDKKRGVQAVKELEKDGLTPKFCLLDIDSVESIRKFKNYLQDSYGKIDVLILNAAMAYPEETTEPFSVRAEVIIRVNFTGNLNVCHELFPLLRENGRVVHLSSVFGHLTQIPSEALRNQFSDPELNESKLVILMNEFVKDAKAGKHGSKWGNLPYGVSKVGITALTRIQQKVFDQDRPNDQILVNCVHPGYVDTDMTGHKGVKTIDEGAIAPVWAALLPVDTVSPRGEYIWHDTQVVDWVKGPTPTPF